MVTVGLSPWAKSVVLHRIIGAMASFGSTYKAQERAHLLEEIKMKKINILICIVSGLGFVLNLIALIRLLVSNEPFLPELSINALLDHHLTWVIMTGIIFFPTLFQLLSKKEESVGNGNKRKMERSEGKMRGKKLKSFCILMIIGISVTTFNVLSILITEEINTFSEAMEHFNMFNFILLFGSIMWFLITTNEKVEK